jgi:hypothetical protein
MKSKRKTILYTGLEGANIFDEALNIHYQETLIKACHNKGKITDVEKNSLSKMIYGSKEDFELAKEIIKVKSEIK